MQIVSFDEISIYFSHVSENALEHRIQGGSLLISLSCPHTAACPRYKHSSVTTLGTLRYEDGKARTATAVNAGNLRRSRRVARNKILKMVLKMCTFAKDGDVNNLNFT